MGGVYPFALVLLGCYVTSVGQRPLQPAIHKFAAQNRSGRICDVSVVCVNNRWYSFAVGSMFTRLCGRINNFWWVEPF